MEATQLFLDFDRVTLGVLLFGLGAALYLVPSVQSVLWPWPLTPLTARAVAAWLVASVWPRAGEPGQRLGSPEDLSVVVRADGGTGVSRRDPAHGSDSVDRTIRLGICHCLPWCWPPVWRGCGKSEAEQGRHL